MVELFPFLVPIALFAMIAAIVLGAYYEGIIKNRDRTRAIEKIIDSGQPLTPELLKTIQDTLRSNAAQPTLTSALQPVFIGIALAVLFTLGYIFQDMPAFLIAVGLFPLAVGAARLIGYYHQKKHPEDKGNQ